MVAICEVAARERREDVECHAIVSQAGEEFCVNGAMDRVIHALVHRRTDPAILDA